MIRVMRAARIPDPTLKMAIVPYHFYVERERQWPTASAPRMHQQHETGNAKRIFPWARPATDDEGNDGGGRPKIAYDTIKMYHIVFLRVQHPNTATVIEGRVKRKCIAVAKVKSPSKGNSNNPKYGHNHTRIKIHTHLVTARHISSRERIRPWPHARKHGCKTPGFYRSYPERYKIESQT